jgi:hypothetical protein
MQPSNISFVLWLHLFVFLKINTWLPRVEAVMQKFSRVSILLDKNVKVKNFKSGRTHRRRLKTL